MIDNIKNLSRGLKKIIIKIILIILVAIVILNYIPIKFAKNIEHLVLKEGEYICQVELKSGLDEKWGIFRSIPMNYPDEIFVNIFGNVPFNTLSSKDFYLYSNKENQYIVTGELILSHKNGIYNIGNIEIKDWEIVYPVNRSSFRRNFTPKTYLTIYDYNLVQICKDFIN